MSPDRTPSTAYEIREDDPGRPEVLRLLQHHLADVARHSPPESVHALDLDGLRAPDLTFWSVSSAAGVMGCGALKELDVRHGELKSMKTDPDHVRQGVAAALLEHLISVARTRGYSRLSLETGSGPAFAPARALYTRFGFELCGPFGPYVEDPYSVFMTREL